jgi:signal transduction histidine kinase
MSGRTRPAAARGPADARPGGGDETRLAAIAHDLRTPLNAIKTWSAVLADELREASPAAQRALRGIEEGVAAQARLIEDLLDPARDPHEDCDAFDKAARRGER